MTATQAVVHRGDAVDLDLRIANRTDAAITFSMMSCSWQDQWKVAPSSLTIVGATCDKNFPKTFTVAPAGGVEARRLRLSVPANAPVGNSSVRFGFTPIGANTTVWTAPIAFQIREVAHDVTITSAATGKRTFTFALDNTTQHPIRIADRLELQRLVDGTWVDMSWISASSCRNDFNGAGCVELGAGKTLSPTPWQGTTCAQCICDGNAPAEPGHYRLVARTCTGDVDFVGGDTATRTIKRRLAGG